MTPAHYLRPLLAPRSIALVGASERAGSLGRIVYENLLGGGFQGDAFAVNPRHATVLGQRSYASLSALGRSIDLAVICAPPREVPAIITEARGRASAAVIMSGAPAASVAEYQQWRRQLADARENAGIRVLGPASFGVIRTSLGLNATYGQTIALPGRLALISQSGAMVGALLDFARLAAIGFSSVIALGAGADVGFAELLDFASNDADTDAVLLYVESVRPEPPFTAARLFMSALRALARAKPVIVLKAGRHRDRADHGPRADEVFEAVFRRAGTMRVHTYTQLFAAARILAMGRLPRGNRIAIVSNGRGPGLLAADRAVDTNVALARFSEETCAQLRKMLPREHEITNPLDVHGEATPERFAAAVATVLHDPEVDALLALHVSLPAAPPTDTASAVAAAAKNAGKLVLGAWLGALDRPEARKALEAGSVADFYSPENAIEAFSLLVAYERNQEWLLEVPPPVPEFAIPDFAKIARVVKQAPLSARTTLDRRAVRSLLSAFGIDIAPAKARNAQRRVASRNAVDASTSRRIRLGMYANDLFGPVLTYAPGDGDGQALAVMLPPLSQRLASDVVAGGHDNALPPQMDPIVALLLKLSALACALPWVVEIEIIIALSAAGDAAVVDARIVVDTTRPPTADGYRHMAIHPYPVELETMLELRDASVRLRPIRPEDAVAEQAFVASLSEQSRYLRFMQHLSALTPRMLARFTQVDYDREMAMIAIDGAPPNEKIVGVVRYAANPDHESAEFAVTVADDWHGKGLGKALMRSIIDIATRRGFRRLMGVVLSINAPMLRLAQALGFNAAADPNDREQVIVTLDLK